jgi:hypothetical protein
MSSVGVMIGVGNGVVVAVGGNHTVVGVMVAEGCGVCVGVMLAGVDGGDTTQAEIRQPDRITAEIFLIKPGIAIIFLNMSTIS